MTISEANATTALTTSLHDLPAELRDVTRRDAGQGVSNKTEDNLLPLVYTLQNGSPICDKRSENYIDGAEPGHFWLRNALDPIRSGIEGITVIPCAMRRTWLRFRENRGGFMGIAYDEQPANAVERIIQGDSGPRKALVLPDDNSVLVDTREFYVLLDGLPYVLPCKSTQHTFARKWNSYFQQLRHPETGECLPSWIHKYKLTTLSESDGEGHRWFGMKFTDIGPVNLAEYQAAKKFHDFVKSGAARVAPPVTNGAE
jgi:hypothetical protein